MYTLMLLFQAIHVNLIYSPLKWKEDVINVHYSQNVRPAGLWCDICNSIVFTACMLVCKSAKVFGVIVTKFEEK